MWKQLAAKGFLDDALLANNLFCSTTYSTLFLEEDNTTSKTSKILESMLTMPIPILESPLKLWTLSIGIVREESTDLVTIGYAIS